MRNDNINISLGREHARFLGAVFIACVTSQASVLVDTSIGGYLLGENVVSAVNLVLPIEEIFYGLSLLLGMGACTSASFAFGKGQRDQVNSHFTAAMLSATVVFVSLCVALLLMRNQVVHILCGESYLKDSTLAFLTSALPYFVFGNIINIVIEFVSMTGKPQLAMYSTLVFIVSKALFNFLLISVFGFGVEALGYSSLIGIFLALTIILPYWLKAPFRLIRLPFRQLMFSFRSNLHYGKGLITGEISYILFSFAMNSLVLKYSGEKGLFCWSVVIMVFLVCDYASAAAQETCLSLGGKYIGLGRTDCYDFIFKRSVFFTIIWALLCMGLTISLPELFLPLFGASDVSDYPILIPALAMTVPASIGLNLVNNYLVQLISKNRVEKYSMLVAILYFSVPLFFFVAHFIAPGQEWWGFSALIPLQLVLMMISRT